MATEIEMVEALQNLVTTIIAALGEEKSKPFEIEAYYEYAEGTSFEELVPRIKLVKK